MLQETAETYSAPEPFDVVCAFEVLEHLEDDAAALANWKRHIGPGGWLLLSVPAGRNRFGPADAKAGHFRRYDRTDLADLVARAGYVEVEILSYGFPLGYALEAVRNLYARRATRREEGMEDRTAASGRWLQPPEGSGRVLQGLSAPFRRAQRPFARTNLGTGLVARARRAGGSYCGP